MKSCCVSNLKFNLLDDERLLCLVRLYVSVHKTKYPHGNVEKELAPYTTARTPGSPHASDKYIVTSAQNVMGYAGLLKSSVVAGRFYIIYPDMICGNDITLGEISQV